MYQTYVTTLKIGVGPRSLESLCNHCTIYPLLNQGIKESAAPGWSLNPCDAVITNIVQCV